jgi:hypothetical protein
MAYALAPGLVGTDTYSPDVLFAGPFPVITQTVTLAQAAGALKRGSVLGVVTASGKYLLSASAAGDGSQVPSAILVQDSDATAGDLSVPVYFSGDFNFRALTLGAGHTQNSITGPLRDASIFIHTSLSATPV